MSSQSGDQDIAELLTRSGSRQQPSAAARQRVHAQLLKVWEELPDVATDVQGELSSESSRLEVPPVSQSRTPVWALAAAVSIATIGAMLLWQSRTAGPETPVADIAYSTGGYAISPAADGSSRLFVGSTVTTSGQGRLLLALDAQTSVRIDQNTSATLRTKGEIYLHSGRVYVDSHGGNNTLQITTPTAAITKVGTQFEVLVQDDKLEVAVREGAVKVARELDQNSAQASNGVGDVLRYAHGGLLTKTQVPTTDVQRWQWTQLSRPDFDMSQANYYAYLRWAARERGLILTFADPMLEQFAKSQTGAGRYDASDADIKRVLQTERYYSRLPSAAHELRIGRR